MVRLLLRDVTGSLHQNLTISLPVREVRVEGWHVDTQHHANTKYMRWNPYVLASSHCPEPDTGWLEEELHFLQALLS